VQLPILTVRARAWLAAALTCAGAVPLPAAAAGQERRTIHAPMVFHADGGPLRTTACLELTERVYPASRWWEQAAAGEGAAERAFKAVMAAIRKKDRAALLELTDAAQAKDTAEFDKQARAFFAQLAVIELVAVPRAYEFDGLLVFFGTFKAADQTAVVPLVFATRKGETFGFLPARARGVTFTLVSDWFTATAPPGSSTPAYCEPAVVKRATHRVALAGSRWQPSALLLSGAPLESPSPAGALVSATIDRMKAALREGKVSAFLGDLTPEGAARLGPWLETAPAAEVQAYKSAFVEQQPFFVFDASPLIVVYTRTPTGLVQALYFTPRGDTRLAWTNSSYITVADQVFKQGPLHTAAAAKPPFRGLVIK
jgi:hypothetical protein